MNYYLRNFVLSVLTIILVAGCTAPKDRSANPHAEPTESPGFATANTPNTTSDQPVLYRVVKDPRIEKMAKVLVEYSVAVKKGDVVVIGGPSIATPPVA